MNTLLHALLEREKAPGEVDRDGRGAERSWRVARLFRTFGAG